MMTVVRSMRVVVTRRLGMAVMVAGSREMSSSGMRANGMPKDKMIWEYRSARVVLTAKARTVSEGSMVSVRRAGSGSFQVMQPARTTWPEVVPTLEEDRP